MCIAHRWKFFLLVLIQEGHVIGMGVYRSHNSQKGAFKLYCI